MTCSIFIEECLTRTILPELAIENELIVLSLAERDDEKTLALLDSEF